MRRGRPDGEAEELRPEHAIRRRPSLAALERLGFARSLALVCLLGLVIRILYVVVLQRTRLPFHGDSFIYWGQANLLAEGKGWIAPLSVFKKIQVADHPPLYIVYLTIAALVDPARITSQLTFMVWTCFLGTGSVLLCGLAGREIKDVRVGIIAALVAAVDPNMWVQDGLLLSESMAIFVGAGVILFAYRYWRRPSWARAAWLGVWCGLAPLARSELVLVVPFVLLPVVLLTRTVDLRRRFTWLGIGVVCTALVVAPWIGFNAARFKAPVLLSTNFGRTMAAASCHATFYGSSIGYKNYTCLRTQTQQATTPSMDQSQQDRALRKVATKYVKSHIRRLPLVVLARWGRVLEVFKPYQDLRSNGLRHVQGKKIAYVVIWAFYVSLILGIAGAVVLRRSRLAPLFPLLALPAAVLLSVAVTFGQQRYRAPMQPTLVILGAVALDALGRQFVRRRSRRGVDEPSSPGEPVTALSS
jgi:4-amino-4-deoxy-L-arabinose transferase-like glycosyltransferase